MKTYYFRIYQCGDPDGNGIHVSANSWEEAEQEVQREYHSIDKLLKLYSE